MNYVAPVAEIELDFAHDRWEYEGDYSMAKRVCLKIYSYNEKEKVVYNRHEAWDM